jgi:hypothetical protein
MMYFLTLIPFGYELAGSDASPRCIGYSSEPFRLEQLTEHDAEVGYFVWAVQEKFPVGLWPVGEVLEWWRWTGDEWVVADPPEWSYKVNNWAIG